SATPAATTVVVVESGGMSPSLARSGDAVTLRAEPHAAPGDLLRRTLGTVGTLERTGQSVALAILGCNDDVSALGLERRGGMARALMAAVLHTDGGRLVLVARRDAPPKVRQGLLALAGTLTEGLAGTTASVSVVF